MKICFTISSVHIFILGLSKFIFFMGLSSELFSCFYDINFVFSNYLEYFKVS